MCGSDFMDDKTNEFIKALKELNDNNNISLGEHRNKIAEACLEINRVLSDKVFTDTEKFGILESVKLSIAVSKVRMLRF
jgi:hypothetical protein